MAEPLHFATREAFRAWLGQHAESGDGVWLLFGKPGGPNTLKAAEALEEALCFGWIDGQMQSINAQQYRKYFSPRRQNSKWSAKNKAFVEKLESQGRMTDLGRVKIEEAKRNGQWDAPPPEPITDAQIDQLCELLREYEPAHTNFITMPSSAKKTYTRAYFDAKTDDGRKKRMAWMVERLNKNLRPM